MKQCKVLLPPIKLGDRTIEETGAIISLSDADAKALSATGTVQILEEGQESPPPPPEPEPEEPQSEEQKPVISAPDLLAEVPTLGLVNLNTATEEELITLPNVGKVIAQKIIKGRPYESPLQAKVASGLKESQWAEVETGVTI